MPLLLTTCNSLSLHVAVFMHRFGDDVLKQQDHLMQQQQQLNHQQQAENQHFFQEYTFKKIASCDVCKDFLRGKFFFRLEDQILFKHNIDRIAFD